MALSANSTILLATDPHAEEYAVDAAKHIYHGALLGRNVGTGYVGPFRVCDEFAGLAWDERDNSAGSAGALNVDALSRCAVRLPLTGVSRRDIGKAVYATDDNGIALSGHALGYAGRIVGLDVANYCIVQLKTPGELPLPTDQGTVMFRGGGYSKATGNNGAGTEYLDSDGAIVASTLGLGVIPNDLGQFTLSLDDTDEASHASVLTYAKFQALKGLVLRSKLTAYSTAGVAMTGANVDLEWGIAEAVVKTNVDPAYHLRCHVDGATQDILVGADDGTHDVAETDTTVNLGITAVPLDEVVFVLRPVGATVLAEVYINGTLVATPSLATIDMASATDLSVYANLEKSSAAGVAIAVFGEFAAFGGK